MEEPDPRLWQTGDADKTRSHRKEGRPHEYYTRFARADVQKDTILSAVAAIGRGGPGNCPRSRSQMQPKKPSEPWLVAGRRPRSQNAVAKDRTHSRHQPVSSWSGFPQWATPSLRDCCKKGCSCRGGAAGAGRAKRDAGAPRPCTKQITGTQPISQQRRCGGKRTLSEFCNSLLARARQKA